MRLGKKEEGKDRGAPRFAGVGVAAAVNLTTANSRNVGYLGSILSNREMEKMKELVADSLTLGEEARREDEGAWSS